MTASSKRNRYLAYALASWMIAMTSPLLPANSIESGASVSTHSIGKITFSASFPGRVHEMSTSTSGFSGIEAEASYSTGTATTMLETGNEDALKPGGFWIQVFQFEKRSMASAYGRSSNTGVRDKIVDGHPAELIIDYGKGCTNYASPTPGGWTEEQLYIYDGTTDILVAAKTNSIRAARSFLGSFQLSS